MDDSVAYQEQRSPNLKETTDFDSETPQDTDEPPQTEEEMRHCKHCDFQAEDWPTFATHVFKQAHLKNIAEAYNIRLSADPVSSMFSCDVCRIDCTGQKSWVAHLLGAKHSKSLDLLSNEKAESKKAHNLPHVIGGPMKNTQFGNAHNKKPYDRMPNIQPSNTLSFAAQDFANYPEPLIGLEYVTEIQVTGEIPRYECSLCDTKFDHKLKFPHLVGQKHRINVLKIKRPNATKGLGNLKRSEITTILTQAATELEQEEGRQEVKTKVTNLPRNSNANYFQNNAVGGRGGTRGGRGTARGADRSTSRGTTWRGVSSRRSGQRGAGRGNPAGYTTRGGWSNSTGFGQSAGVSTDSSPYASYESSDQSYGHFSGASNSNFDDQNYGQTYNMHSEQTYSRQTCPELSGNSGPVYSTPPLRPMRREPLAAASDAREEGVSAGLASTLGSLVTKLVQNEEDASVALQVSNALTQALLKYRLASEIEAPVNK